MPRLHNAKGREAFEQRMEARRKQADDGAEWGPVRHGWCLGSEEFRQQVLARITGQVGEHHAGGLRSEAAEHQAEKIIAKELKRLKWKEADLERRHKSDPAKLALAVRLRRETTLTIKWIAARLHLGHVQRARVRMQALAKAKPKVPNKTNRG
ncbi:MAG: hypothetical protein WCO56_22815 [Verrucomicrobiota bacterium]